MEKYRFSDQDHRKKKKKKSHCPTPVQKKYFLFKKNGIWSGINKAPGTAVLQRATHPTHLVRAEKSKIIIGSNRFAR